MQLRLNYRHNEMMQHQQAIKSGNISGNMSTSRALKIAEVSYDKWFESLNAEEQHFVKFAQQYQSSFHGTMRDLYNQVHDTTGYTLADFISTRDNEFKPTSYSLPKHYGKMHSGFVDELFYKEGISPKSDIRYNFSIESRKHSQVPPKHGVPHITHHIWVGHQDATGNFKQPNNVNTLVTLQTIDKFDASWKHYFWTNDLKAVPNEIKHDKRFEVKSLSEIKDLALKDKIELLAQNHFFGAASGDILRLSILKEYGGVYLDMDYKVVKTLNDLADTYDFVSGYDAKNGEYMGNAFIMACKNHPIVNTALTRIERNLNDEQAPDYLKKAFTLFNWVIMATGPAAFTSAFFDGANTDGHKDIGFETGIIFDINTAIKAARGEIPAITDPAYDSYLNPEALGNDRFGGTWAIADTWDPDYLDEHKCEVFSGIYELPCTTSPTPTF